MPPNANRPDARQARLRLLAMHYRAGVGHIGGNLSALDTLLHLHQNVLTPDDIFVLSKGHAAGALYIALWAADLLSEAQLETFHANATTLAGHPIAGWHPHIRFATGSLGHGLSLACGLALAKRLRAEPGTIYCLLSDGECEEGAIWEALIFARHQNLANLVILIDVNGLQGFGATQTIASLEPLAGKFRAFGLPVEDIDGHNQAALTAALETRGGAPLVILLRTIKGKGVSFMENRMEWHYLPLTQPQYEQAVAELSA